MMSAPEHNKKRKIQEVSNEVSFAKGASRVKSLPQATKPTSTGKKATKKNAQETESEEEIIVVEDKENVTSQLNTTSTTGGLFSLYCKSFLPYDCSSR